MARNSPSVVKIGLFLIALSFAFGASRCTPVTATSQKALTTSETQPKVTEVLEQPTPTLVEPTPTNTSTPTTTPTSTPEPTPTLTPTLEPLVSPDLEADFLWNGETATIGLLSSEPYRYANGVVDAIFSDVITAIYSTEIESEGEEVTVWMADFFLGYSEQKEPIIKRFLLLEFRVLTEKPGP